MLNKLITNQKVLTISLIVIGLSILGINFLVMRSVNQNLEDSLSKLPEVAQKEKASVSKTLPDIKSTQKLSESAIRNQELEKIKNNLPYTDTKKGITIAISPSTKLIIAGITSAKDLTDYREKKVILEQKLYEFGATNLCSLALVWAPPTPSDLKFTPADVHTSDCAY